MRRWVKTARLSYRPSKLRAWLAIWASIAGATGVADWARPTRLRNARTDAASCSAQVATHSAGLARDFQQVRLEFLGRRARSKAPGECVATWAEQEAASVRAFRSLVGRAQSATPVAPAMLAQIASQARNLLGR